jgi:integrase
MTGQSSYRAPVGAATVTATYVRHGRRWRVLIRPLTAPRISRVVATEQEAKDLVHFFNRRGMEGFDLGQALREAQLRTATTPPSYPPIREAMPTFLDRLVALGEIRQSTAQAYKNRLAVWTYPLIGDTPWNLVTREQIGGVLLKVREARKSRAALEQIRCPLTRFYQWQINVNRYQGANPAGDLRFFIGKQPGKRGRKRDLQWFPVTEAQTLLEVCRELKPRWYPFLLVCFGGGLRWGEATALYRADVDWTRGRLHVQRTWSEDGGRIERCKDGEDRWVKLPASATAALRAHSESMELEAGLGGWTHEQRKLVFPNTVGRVTRYGAFVRLVWQPLLKATKLPYRKPHSMRHSYATWMLEEGADLRYVKDQLGHSSIEETEGTYGHLERERHEQRVDLDRALSPRSAASTGVHESDAGDAVEDQVRDFPREMLMVEGKGFEPSTSALRTPRSPN